VQILYRVRQFWRAVSLKTDLHGLEQAHRVLSSEQWQLFEQLQPAEKSHAFAMYQKLLEQGETQQDLMVAALLHDVGKLRYRLNPLERAMIVLVRAVFPSQAHDLGSLPPGGWDGLPSWQKVFIVAEQHALWGAEMARQVGVSSLAESLIREHNCPPSMDEGAGENDLHYKLWVVDNES